MYVLTVTGEILRTNVIVGEIVRLEIETTTRLLYLEDSPEELIVRGFDSEGKPLSLYLNDLTLYLLLPLMS